MQSNFHFDRFIQGWHMGHRHCTFHKMCSIFIKFSVYIGHFMLLSCAWFSGLHSTGAGGIWFYIGGSICLKLFGYLYNGKTLDEIQKLGVSNIVCICCSFMMANTVRLGDFRPLSGVEVLFLLFLCISLVGTSCFAQSVWW